MSKIDENVGEDCGQWSRRASKILNVRAVCDLPRHVWEQNTKKKSTLDEENESKSKKNKKNDANDHRKIMLSQTEGRALLLNFIHWVAGREKMMDARRLEKLPYGHWTPENVVWRRQTPLWKQTPDASKISLWTLDAYKNTPQDARRQTYSPLDKRPQSSQGAQF